MLSPRVLSYGVKAEKVKVKWEVPGSRYSIITVMLKSHDNVT